MNLFLTDFFDDRRNVDPDRADSYTAAAAGAECLPEFIVVVFELVHDTVAVSLRLQIAWIVPRGVAGELPETAGIPALAAFAGLLCAFVNDIKTVAGGTDKSTGAAADTDLFIYPGNHQIAKVWHHLNCFGRTMFRAGATGSMFGYDNADIFDKF